MRRRAQLTLAVESVRARRYSRAIFRTADEQMFRYVSRWSAGKMGSWPQPGETSVNASLLAVTTPEPWRFLVAFCEEDDRGIFPLLLLKNAVPLSLYGETCSISSGSEVAPGAWKAMRKIVLLHNPGLGGCLDLFARNLPFGD